MQGQILEQLFESPSKVRLLKLFLRNQKAKFTTAEVRARAQLDVRSAQTALEKLRSAGIIKSYTKKNAKPRGKKGIHEKTYFINPSFIFFEELRNLVLKSSPASKTRIVKRMKGLGRIKLLVLSGIFMKPDRALSRTDILVVGDDVSQKRFENFLKQLEAEVGCEIQYSLLTSDEFHYRYELLDRFLRDILERPNEILINKLGV